MYYVVYEFDLLKFSLLAVSHGQIKERACIQAAQAHIRRDPVSIQASVSSCAAPSTLHVLICAWPLYPRFSTVVCLHHVAAFSSPAQLVHYPSVP